jgi:hypothetical protein
MECKLVGDDLYKGAKGITWRAHRFPIRRSIAAGLLAGAMLLGVFGATQSGQSHATQSAGSTWSVRVPGPMPMGSTWS